jgi:hypothetical protein
MIIIERFEQGSSPRYQASPLPPEARGLVLGQGMPDHHELLRVSGVRAQCPRLLFGASRAAATRDRHFERGEDVQPAQLSDGNERPHPSNSRVTRSPRVRRDGGA